MAGTKVGGRKAAAKNLARNPNFYKEIGAKGGKNGHTGGFYANRELARKAGAKGGHISRRGKKLEEDIMKDAALENDGRHNTRNKVATKMGFFRRWMS